MQASRWRGFVGLAAGLALAAAPAWAQRNDVTVRYLRAAMGAIEDRERVTITADYTAESGLTEARGTYLRGKGFSRFTVTDTDSDLTFASMYCEQSSKAFDELLGVKGRQRFIFEGYKGLGESREAAIFVTSLSAVAPAAVPSEKPVMVDRPRTYRVTIMDRMTSNRTALVNVELGKAYTVFGSTLVIDEETGGGAP